MNLEKIKQYISLRKINSLVVLIIFFLLFEHALLSSLYLMGIINYSPNFQKTGRRLFLWVALHVLISLYLFIKDKRKQSKTYNHIRNDTQLQIISGISIILFGLLHVITYGMAPANIINHLALVHFIIDNLLFVSLVVHLQISIPKLLISLGYLTGDKSYQKARNKIRKILFALLILLFIAELIHYII